MAQQGSPALPFTFPLSQLKPLPPLLSLSIPFSISLENRMERSHTLATRRKYWAWHAWWTRVNATRHDSTRGRLWHMPRSPAVHGFAPGVPHSSVALRPRCSTTVQAECAACVRRVCVSVCVGNGLFLKAWEYVRQQVNALCNGKKKV